MTTLEITPRWADKTARFKGTVAAGESVSVTVKGAAEWTAGGGLRLRVLGFHGETLAQFPPEVEIEDESATPEAWGADESNTDATCTLNLRTDRMMRAVPPGATMQFLFVLDDATDDGETLYFKELHEITHWPQRTGEDNPPPYAMRGYRDFVKDVLNRVDAVETQIGNLTLRAERSTETEGGVERNGVKITIWDGAEGTEPAVVKLYDGEVSLAQMNAAIASAVAGRATTAALDSEASTRAAADAALQAALATLTGADVGYSARQIAAMEVAKVVAGADASFDTLKEIADWITNDTTGAAKMANDISALKSGKVDKVAGKGLSTEDFTTAEKKKLANLPADPSGVIVDDELSATSKNPVQNKVVKAAVDAKADAVAHTQRAVTVTVPATLRDSGAADGYNELQCRGIDPSGPEPVVLYTGLGGALYAVINPRTGSIVGGTNEGEDAYQETLSDIMSPGWMGSALTKTEEAHSALTLYAQPRSDMATVDVTYYVTVDDPVARMSDVPTKTSDLENDSGFLAEHQRLVPLYSDTPVYGEWTFSKPGTYSIQESQSSGGWEYYLSRDGVIIGGTGFPERQTKIVWPDKIYDDSAPVSTRVRTDVVGYTLGAQTDKPIQPQGNYLTEHQDISGKADKYPWAEATVKNGVIALRDAKVQMLEVLQGGAAFTVSPPSGTSAMARDMVLVIDCSSLTEGDEPTVTWDVNFHPRTDAGTDFACAAGVRNVYYISEYDSGLFVVGGWHETAGGSAT